MKEDDYLFLNIPDKDRMAGFERFSTRDSWCTPKWLTDLLPKVDLDPCSNERSTVKANIHLRDSGLTVDWDDHSVFVNPPYSDILPWAKKAAEAYAFIFLVNHDHTTKWWQELRKNGGHHVFFFDKRIKFEPPPGIVTSSNSRPQSLVCNAEGRRMIGDALHAHGTWWMAE